MIKFKAIRKWLKRLFKKPNNKPTLKDFGIERNVWNEWYDAYGDGFKIYGFVEPNCTSETFRESFLRMDEDVMCGVSTNVTERWKIIKDKTL